jgi:tRNA(His) guanylyltransferase
MKKYEIYSDLKIPYGSKIVIRADGRNFSGLTSRLELKKPYDPDFVKIMVDTCLDFFREFSPSFMYTFSDEINILLDEIPFAGRLEKINSIFASFIAGSFTRRLLMNEKFFKSFKDGKTTTSPPIKPVSFDCRVVPLNPELVIEYFKSRQDEAWRNCLNGYAYWTLRQEYGKEEASQILNKKKSSQIHDILFEREVNVTDKPLWQRRGVGIYRKKVSVEGYNPLSHEDVLTSRWKPFPDWELPLFKDEFFKIHQL